MFPYLCKEMKKNASIEDIAERLRLSVATVSFTLSGRGGDKRISPETQERVRACAKEMNYRPNLLTSSMRHPNYYSLSIRSKSGFTARCFSVRKRVLVK